MINHSRFLYQSAYDKMLPGGEVVGVGVVKGGSFAAVVNGVVKVVEPKKKFKIP